MMSPCWVFSRIWVKLNNLKISNKFTIFYALLLTFSILISSLLYQKIYSSIITNKVSEVSAQTLYSISTNIDSVLDNIDILSKADGINNLTKKANI